ncbi:hypothetical protein DSO57_1028780 [Entomophthora muscae]|uniref:Uncharacterized protein n=1 Tax=Entomophthora muscae TaxID=34485 RepID=A0ACC2TCI3_9FUNG|nr:hypothetical protein DSO57_1028780 [Entomophthora muscae]
MEPHDMLLSIDGRHKYFFPSQYSTTQSYNENTFLDTVCHEILHGMGISTSFIKNDNTSPSYVKFTTGNQVRFTFFTNAFEKHIYTRNGHSISKWVNIMNKENPTFEVSSDAKVMYTKYQAAIANFIQSYIQIPNGLYFKTKDNKKIYLETGQPFDLGTKISHISTKYNTTTDRLIVPRLLTGQGMHDIDKKGWKTSPFGQRTLQTLETMGYKLNPNPKYEQSLAYFNDKKNGIN